MTIEEVKQIIANSKFDPGLKQRLLLILPSLGKYTLLGLGKEVSRGDALIIADYIVSLWENFAVLLAGLKNRDERIANNLPKFLKVNLLKLNQEDQLFVLNFVLDVRGFFDNEKVKSASEQYWQLIDYEIKLFWQLPKEEILFLFRNHILYLAQRINLLKDTQVAVYKNELDLDDNFHQAFLDSLYQNAEVLGVKNPKTVGVWVKDFFNFATPSRSQASTFGIAEFLLKGTSVQKLAESEKRNLSEILKLVLWLNKPILSEEEVIKYEEEVKDREAEKLEQLYAVEAGEALAVQPKPFKPQVPRPPMAKVYSGGPGLVKSPPDRRSISDEPKEKLAPVTQPARAATEFVPQVRPINPADAYQPLSRYNNMQHILQNKQHLSISEHPDEQAGLKMGDGGGGRMQNEEFRMKNGQALNQDNEKSVVAQLNSPMAAKSQDNPKMTIDSSKPITELKQMDINRKLAELRKKAGGKY